jgi:hypothetical protein
MASSKSKGSSSGNSGRKRAATSKRGAGARGRSSAKASSGSAGSKAASKGKAPSSRTSTGGSRAAKSAPAKKRRGSGKRDLVKTPTGSFFAHREADGQFREMDEVGRSLAADRRQKAKTKVASGYGDRGDR